jgi:hypothetical protein
MTLPFVIDNKQHRLADVLKEFLAKTTGKPLDIPRESALGFGL